MSNQLVSRRSVLGAGVAGTLGVLLAPGAVLADEEAQGVVLLRWDLVDVTQGVILAGGKDFARDAASRDVVQVTGSGEASPKLGLATGGGTIVHRHADGTEVAHAVYHVTAFKSFRNGGGTLVGVPVIDGIGTLEQTTSGELFVEIEAFPSGGGSVKAILGVHCRLPGGEPIEEGVTLNFGPFESKQAGGQTLFHVLQGEHRA